MRYDNELFHRSAASLPFRTGHLSLGKKLNWSRHAKIVVGLFIFQIFIAYSSLLYGDFVRFTIPFFANQKGSEFMFHTDIIICRHSISWLLEMADSL